MSTAAALCRQAINHHDSTIHHLPPEVLAAVASHLDDKKSLIAATHVCHRWRSTFLSLPRLWSRVVFSDIQRALAFLERSKSVTVSVCLPGGNEPFPVVKESLKSIAGRLVGLKGAYNKFLGEFLTQPLPLLRDLDLFGPRSPPGRSLVPSLPSVRSLTTYAIDYPPLRVKNLTNFHFKLPPCLCISPTFGGGLLEFLRSCPLLEVVHFCYGHKHRDIGSTISGASTEMVSLPCLRSFTHDSFIDKVDMALFDRLSVPPTCDLAFAVVIRSRSPGNRPWAHAFPTPRNPSYISDVKTVKVIANFQDTHNPRPTFRTEFFNSKNARISFNRTSDPHSTSTFIKLLNFLESSGITHSVETLRLENLHEGLPMNLPDRLTNFDNLKTLILWQCRPAPFLFTPPPAMWCRTVQKLVVCLLPPTHPRGAWDEVADLRRVRNLAAQRKKHGVPLGAVTTFSRDIKYLSQGSRREMEELKSCVGSMEVVGLGD